MNEKQFETLVRSIKAELKNERWRLEADDLLSNLDMDLDEDDEVKQCRLAVKWYAQTFDGSHMINVYKCDVSGKDRWLAISCSDGGVAVFLDGPSKTFDSLVGKMQVPEGWTFL